MAVQDIPNPIVHRVNLGANGERVKAKTKLEEVMAERESRAAQRYSIAELEKMALESENEASRLRGEPPKHKYTGGTELDEEERKKREEQRQQLMESARALIDSGMEPRQVGQMLLGLPFAGQPGSPVVTQGMGMEDVLKIVDMIVGRKEVSELRSVIAALDKKIDDLAKGGGRHREDTPHLSPQDFARQQAEAFKIWHETVNELIPKPVPMSEKGEPLEVVKERHRHEERLEEMKNDREYKGSLVEVASEIPERVGRGIAGQIMGSGKSGATDGNLEVLECEECHEKIYITPDTGNQVTCPSCHMVYTRHIEEVPK